MKKNRLIATGLGLGITAAASLFNPAPASAADIPVLTLYEHINFGGAADEWGGPHMCNDTLSDIEYDIDSLPGFNDITSSFQGHNNCWARLYQHSNFGGTSLAYASQRSFVGNSFNDITSSVRLT